MLFDALVTIIVSIINFIIGLLPNFDYSANNFITTQLVAFRNLMISNNWWFPVDALFYIIRLTIVLFTTIYTWLLVRFIAHSISLGKVK